MVVTSAALELKLVRAAVLTLAGAAYVEHGVLRRGAQATSVLLPGFAVAVAAAFDAD